MSWLWNRVLANGQGIYLGDEQGGDLLLGVGNSPGAMTLAAMQAKIWHLLRIDGPANGFPPPTEQSDFPPSTVTGDINNAIAQFISDTGLSASIADRQSTIPVIACLDYPIPPGCISLQKIEYSPAGQNIIYPLAGKSMLEFDNWVGGAINTNSTGQPAIYRQVYAGAVRMFPSPGPGQQASASEGFAIIGGMSPAQDTTVTCTIVIAGVTYQFSYTTQPGDNVQVITQNLVAQINANLNISTYVTASISPTSGASFTIFVGNLTPCAFDLVSDSPTVSVSPTALTTTTPVGDTMTWYYQTNGTLLVNPGDQPGIPDNFHIALCYRVLSDYWDRKSDPGQSDRYLKKYGAAVQQGKAFKYDANQDAQSTLAGEDWQSDGWGVGGGRW